MSGKKSDLNGQAGKGDIGNPISEFAFTGFAERFPIASLSAGTRTEEGLFSFVFSAAKRGVGSVFRFSKGDMITLAVIFLIWTCTGILKCFDIDIPGVKALAFITASYNGLDTGIMSISGGIAAKSFVLAAVSGTLIPLVTSLFTGKMKTEYVGFSRFARTIRKINFKSMKSTAVYFFGVGAAFIFYGFLSVDGSFQNNFTAILAVLSIMKNFGSKSSFLSGLLSRVFRKTVFAENGAFIMMTGLVTGYILSVPVSLKLSNINGIGYIFGGAAVVAGVVLLISGRTERKVEQSI